MPVEVAVTLIRRERKLLLVYNEHWGAFSFPATKRGKPEDAEAAGSPEAEEWPDAAARAVVECLGRPSLPRPILEDFFPEQHLSRREGKLKFYKYKLFEEPFRPDDQVIAASPTVWLTPEEITGGNYRPISPTAVDVVKYLAAYEQYAPALGLTP